MKHAIAELEIALQSAVTNEPIHRAEGNAEQADLCAGRIPELREAIGVLQRHEELRVPDGSRLSAADAARITADAHPMAAQHRLSWMLADIEQAAREGGTSVESPMGMTEGHPVIEMVVSELRGLGYVAKAFVSRNSDKVTLRVSWGSPAEHLHAPGDPDEWSEADAGDYAEHTGKPMPDSLNTAISDSLFSLLDPENSEDIEPRWELEAAVAAVRRIAGIHHEEWDEVLVQQAARIILEEFEPTKPAPAEQPHAPGDPFEWEIPSEFLEPCGTARTPAAIVADAPRTIRQWLETLPDGYRERALRNLEEHSVEGNGDKECESLRQAIQRGFMWPETAEGWDFWALVSRGELPPHPEPQ